MSTETARQAPAYYVLIRLDESDALWYWKVLRNGQCVFSGAEETWADAAREVEQIMGRLLEEGA
jgi:hypothetical protein